MSDPIIVHDELGSFVEYMVDTVGWDANDIIVFLQKPWKWQGEFDRWAESGDHRTDEEIREDDKVAKGEERWDEDR